MPPAISGRRLPWIRITRLRCPTTAASSTLYVILYMLYIDAEKCMILVDIRTYMYVILCMLSCMLYIYVGIRTFMCVILYILYSYIYVLHICAYLPHIYPIGVNMYGTSGNPSIREVLLQKTARPPSSARSRLFRKKNSFIYYLPRFFAKCHRIPRAF